MPTPPSIRAAISGIKSDLVALLQGTASPRQLNSVIRLCHATALGALARRGHLGQLIRLHGLNLSDLAYDCIGDLFARDTRSRYLALEAYFCAHDVTAFSDEDAYLHLQRLSFSKVRHGIFRLYGEMDPQLAKILHNIKIASNSLDLFVEVDRLGETWLVPSLCDPAKHLPPLDADQLASWLRNEATGNEFIPELLGKVSQILRRQDTNSRFISLVTLGLAIRAFYKQKETPALAEPAVVMDDGAIDATRAIRDACDAVKAHARPKYVGSGKVSEGTFEAYFQVIAQMLRAQFVEYDGSEFQLSRSFLTLMPGTSPEEYRKSHRNKLEYLARLARKHVLRCLQE